MFKVSKCDIKFLFECKLQNKIWIFVCLHYLKLKNIYLFNLLCHDFILSVKNEKLKP